MEDIDNQLGAELLRTANKQETHEHDEKQRISSYRGLLELFDFEDMKN
tara:strand:- start:11565 stop:11708 length:144 start_codon:yes stop_codon:yes gene_type:complete